MYAHILRKPLDSIQKAKKKKSMKIAVLTLLQSSIVASLASALVSTKTVPYIIALSVGVSMLGLILISAIVTAFMLEIIMHALGGKGKYYEALAATSYSIVPFSAGLLAGALLLFVPSVGPFLSFIFILPMFALGVAVFFKAVKELFSVDMVTAFAAVVVLVIAEIASIYALAVLSLISAIGAIL